MMVLAYVRAKEIPMTYRQCGFDLNGFDGDFQLMEW